MKTPTQLDISEAIHSAKLLLDSLSTVDLEAAPSVAAAIADKFAQQAQIIVANAQTNAHEVSARELARTRRSNASRWTPTPTNLRKVGVR